MPDYAYIPLNKMELERILNWYEVYQNKTQPTLVDVGLSDSLKQYLETAN